MGWQKCGRGVGFSNCLRVSLFCILGLVALECGTVPLPVAEKTDATQPRLVLLEKDKSDAFLGGQMGKIREKRSSDGVELRYLLADGIDPSRYVPANGSGTWEDGKACTTGQEPLNQTEVELTRKQLEEQRDLLYGGRVMPHTFV